MLESKGKTHPQFQVAHIKTVTILVFLFQSIFHMQAFTVFA